MDEVNYAELISVVYADDINRLAKYIPYFETKSGKDVASTYDGKLGDSKMKFPVYDSTLLSFTNEAGKSKLMDTNYMYKYRSAHITTEKQEADAIIYAKPRDIDLLRAILSRYVLEGRVKGVRWIEGAERKVFLNVLVRLRDMLHDITVHE